MFSNGDLITSKQSTATIYRVATYDPSSGQITAQIIRTPRKSNQHFNLRAGNIVILTRPEQYRRVTNVMDGGNG